MPFFSTHANFAYNSVDGCVRVCFGLFGVYAFAWLICTTQYVFVHIDRQRQNVSGVLKIFPNSFIHLKKRYVQTDHTQIMFTQSNFLKKFKKLSCIC